MKTCAKLQSIKNWQKHYAKYEGGDLCSSPPFLAGLLYDLIQKDAIWSAYISLYH